MSNDAFHWIVVIALMVIIILLALPLRVSQMITKLLAVVAAIAALGLTSVGPASAHDHTVTTTVGTTTSARFRLRPLRCLRPA